MTAPKGDRLVLLLTFLLTVFFDLTLAIEAGLVTAAFVFMFRMADVFEVSAGVKLVDENGDEPATGVDLDQRSRLPDGVEAFQISGPLFFGAANRLDDLLDQFRVAPKVFILRMRLVPVIDASGVHALKAPLETLPPTWHRADRVRIAAAAAARHRADAAASARRGTALRERFRHGIGACGETGA